MSSPDPGHRLESWKDIAAHLGKTVRTTQRWETEGMPVHREVHGSRGYVFAFTGELDAWVASRQTKPEPQTEPAVAAASVRPRWKLWAGTAATLLVAVGLAARSPATEPAWS